jgi:hypothetical protein
MILGGIAIHAEELPNFEAEIEILRAKHNMAKELKWVRVTNQKYYEYRAFVDLFFKWLETNRLTFHCMIIDNHKVRYKDYSGSYELGFYKFFYQLLLFPFASRYHKNNDLYVLMDQRSTGYPLDDLRTILNNGVQKRYKNDRRPFRLVEFRNSKKADALQIADIILGALGYRKNGGHTQPGTRQSKLELSEYILRRARVKPDLPNTPMSKTDFTVWNFLLK